MSAALGTVAVSCPACDDTLRIRVGIDLDPDAPAQARVVLGESDHECKTPEAA